MLRTLGMPLVLVAFALTLTVHAPAEDSEGWVNMFDGETFNGWKINESPESWRIEDGAIVANGPRSHLFYVGQDKPFDDFEFQAEVMTKPNSNAGVYFHTEYQDSGWPRAGYEAQVNNTYKKDPIKTGSLYQVVNVTKPPAGDNEWFTYSIKVQGRRIVVKVDDKVVVDYTEPEDKQPGKDFTRILSEGTFALQAHDPGSEVWFRNLKVRRL